MKHFIIDTYYEPFKKGSPQAFNAIYRHYNRRIYWMGWSLIKDAFVVETLVQDSFLILWEKRELIESPRHLVNFLYTVITNECRWYYARPKNRFDRNCYSLDNFPNYQEYMLGHDPTAIDHHLLDQQKNQEYFEQVVGILPLLEGQRKRLIELCFQHGFKYKTLSEHMGISIKEASNTVTKAIMDIKHILNQEYLLTTNDNTPIKVSKAPTEITPQQARVLELRCQQHYTFAEIAAVLKLSQKEVHRAFTTAYKSLQEKHGQHLQSA